MMKMSRYIWLIVLLLIITVVYGVSVFLVFRHYTRSLTDVVKIDSAEYKENALNFSGIAIKPGQPFTYTVKIKAKIEGEFRFTLHFEKLETTGLEDYVELNITTSKGFVTTRKLTEILDQKTVVFDALLTYGNNEEITLTFLMPKEVGNEAMGLKVDFDIALSTEGNVGEE